MLAQVRNLAAIKACHDGPGVFNDFEFLFDPVARSRCTASTLCAYEAKFQSIFRVTVDDWKFIRKHTAQDLQRRQDGRGRPPISSDLVMSTALLFLGHGTTYLTTSIMIRNGLSETSTLRCIRLFTASVVKRLTPELIKFPDTIAGFERNARAFEARSGIPGIIGAIDGSHIRIAPPKREQKSYYNRKSFYFSPFAGSALSIAMLCDGSEGLATTSTGMLHTHCDPG